MNKKWYGIIALVVIAALIATSIGLLVFTPKKEKWKWYENKEWRYRIRYPADWEVVEGWDIAFYPPTEKGIFPKVYFRIAIPTSSTGSPVSFNETFYSFDTEGLIHSFTREVINKSEFRETKLVNKNVTTEEIKIDNRSGYRVTEILEYLYLDNEEKEVKKRVSNSVWVGKELYGIQFSAPLEEFTRWEKIFESMFSSFEFI